MRHQVFWWPSLHTCMQWSKLSQLCRFPLSPSLKVHLSAPSKLALINLCIFLLDCSPALVCVSSLASLTQKRSIVPPIFSSTRGCRTSFASRPSCTFCIAVAPSGNSLKDALWSDLVGSEFCSPKDTQQDSPPASTLVDAWMRLCMRTSQDS